MKILHVIGALDPGGAEMWLRTLAKYRPSDVKMAVCCTSGRPGAMANEFRQLGVPVMVMSLKKTHMITRTFRKILLEGAYDVVHSHVWEFSGLLLRIAARYGVPVRVAHSHNTNSKHPLTIRRRIYSALMHRWLRKHATHCLACSSEAGSALFGETPGGGIPNKTLYCCIDIESFAQSSTVAPLGGKLGFTQDAIVVGNVGNLRRQKNHGFLIDIADRVVARDTRYHFVVAGDGPLREELETMIAARKLENNVHLLGRRNDVPGLMMHAFACLLFPSLYEGMPLVLVEAGACGLRCVCSDSITSEAMEWQGKLYTRLSLDAAPESWADAVMHSAQLGRLDAEDALDAVRNSHFSPNVCWAELKTVYRGDN